MHEARRLARFVNQRRCRRALTCRVGPVDLSAAALFTLPCGGPSFLDVPGNPAADVVSVPAALAPEVTSRADGKRTPALPRLLSTPLAPLLRCYFPDSAWRRNFPQRALDGGHPS